MKNMLLWQLNCGRRKNAGVELNAIINKMNSVDKQSVMFIQEGCKVELEEGTIFDADIKEPRARIFISKNLCDKGGAQSIKEFSTRDLIAVDTKIDLLDGRVMQTVLCSLYLPTDTPHDNMITEELIKLVDFCRKKNKELLIGMDSNSHEPAWGTRDSNKRGKKLLNFFDSMDLVILNKGNEPTYVKYTLEPDKVNSVIDVTVGTKNVSDLICSWKVDSEIVISDHRCIKMELCAPAIEAKGIRTKKFTDWNKFSKILEESTELKNLKNLDYKMDINTLEASAKIISKLWEDAFNESCTSKVLRCRSKQPWYTEELYHLRRELRRSLNKAIKEKTARHNKRFRQLRTRYNKSCRRARFKNWKKFLRKLDTAKDTAKIFKFFEMGKKPTASALRKSDGTFTSDAAETQLELMHEHFKGARELEENEEWPVLVPSQLELSEVEVEEILECTELDKIIWAIKSFSPFKSAGSDEVFPALLQKSLPNTVTILQTLFRASLLTGYIPSPWRGTRVTFIPKPGKDPSLASSYRPISLTSFVIKTLEKLIDKKVRYTELISSPINNAQHAYRSGRSVESALHNLLRVAEKALQHGGFCLCLCLDVSGAFSETKISSVSRAASNKNVSSWCIRWIESMLTGRQVVTRDCHCTKKFIPIKGISQGGVSSPLYWNLTVDMLIEELTKAGLTVVAYADDLAILNQDRNLNKVRDQINVANRIIEKWCVENGLDVNPEKTQLMLFTNKNIFRNKRKPDFRKCSIARRSSPIKTEAQHSLQKTNPYGNKTCILRGVTMKGIELKIHEKIKYLGVYLDRKLSFKYHLEEIKSKLIRGQSTLSRICKRTWGLEPEKALYIYKSIILPRVTYGSIAFWHKLDRDIKGNKCRIKEIRKAQNIVIKNVMGAMRGTPLIPQLAILNLDTIDTEIKRCAMESFCRLERTGSWKNNHFEDGHTSIEKVMNSLCSERSSEFTELKWRNKKSFVTSTAIRTKVPPSNCVNVFVDASADSESAGIGCVMTWNGETLSLNSKLLHKTSSVEAEKIALWWAAEYLHSHIETDLEYVNFWTDSMTLIKDLEKTAIFSTNTWRCNTILGKLGADPKKKVLVGWLPKRAKNEHSVEADNLARKARKVDSTAPVTENVRNNENIKTSINAWRTETREEIWEEVLKIDGLLCSKLMLQEYGDKRFAAKHKISRNDLRNLVYMITGRAPLGSFLFKLGKGKGQQCRFCKQGKENTLHFLLDCQDQMIRYCRKTALNKEWLRCEELKQLEIRGIVDFASKIDLSKLTNREENPSDDLRAELDDEGSTEDD